MNKKSIILYLMLFMMLLPQVSNGQFYFGKNKVQYTNFDWQLMQTEHFNIYFYVEEKEIARVAAKVSEDAYRRLAGKFNLEIKKKIPLIIYSSPSYFSQTNIVPGLLPESVGGFTEFMKGRVVVPFHGSYADFVHVLNHEMVHVFMLNKISTVLSKYPKAKFYHPPLWFTEGLAEYWSKNWDEEADMILKDMVLTGHMLTIPQMYQVRGSFFMYKLGESICHFIDSAYGPDKLTHIFENWNRGKNFEEIIKITLGDNFATISKKWHYALKQKYFPQIAKSGILDMEADKTTHGGYSVRGVPIMWDDGHGPREWIVYKANRLGYSGIYMTPAEKGRKREVKTILKGENSSDFESLYLLRSGIDANDSGLIVFSSKSKENDVLYIYDINSKKIIFRYEFDSLVACRSPRFSHDNKYVVFSGVQKDGYSNLYLLSLKGGEFYNLTSDIYNDTSPLFSLDDKKVIFVSDRNQYGKEGATNLYQIDVDSKEIKQLTSGNFRDQSPDICQDGIYFSSTRKGGYDIFLLDNDNHISKTTSYLTGAFNPRYSSYSDKLIFSGYQNRQFQIYQTEISRNSTKFEPMKIASESEKTWVPGMVDGKYSNSSIKYDTDYSLDIAQSSIGYDPVYGSIGGVQAMVSDLLGNKAYYILLTNTARTKDELFESFNFGVTFINREKRLNWGIGGFHLFNEFFNDFDGFFTERQAGGIALLSYPFSKFHRLDFTTVGRYSKKVKNFGFTTREAFLVTNYVSWIFDNSLWDYTGPLQGKRYNLSLGYTTSIGKSVNLKGFNRFFMTDIRHYIRLGKYSALASRLFAYSSTGREPQRIYFGGSWSFRGFDRRAFYNRNVIFASHELRYPLIDNLLIGFPFGNLGFRGIRGALFFDVGSSWDDNFDELLGSFGTGFRFSLGGVILLRFDFSRTTDFETISKNTDFDFFFGWNF